MDCGSVLRAAYCNRTAVCRPQAILQQQGLRGLFEGLVLALTFSLEECISQPKPQFARELFVDCWRSLGL